MKPRQATAIIVLATILLGPVSAGATGLPTFNTQSYCRSIGDAVGGSYEVELGCQHDEQITLRELQEMAIPKRVAHYCTSVANSIGGSYQVFLDCSKDEIRARTALRDPHATKPYFPVTPSQLVRRMNANFSLLDAETKKLGAGADNEHYRDTMHGTILGITTSRMSPLMNTLDGIAVECITKNDPRARHIYSVSVDSAPVPGYGTPAGAYLASVVPNLILIQTLDPKQTVLETRAVSGAFYKKLSKRFAAGLPGKTSATMVLDGIRYTLSEQNWTRGALDFTATPVR